MPIFAKAIGAGHMLSGCQYRSNSTGDGVPNPTGTPRQAEPATAEQAMELTFGSRDA